MTEEQERCPNCGGLGATVEEYQATDPRNGETFTAWRQKPCDTCGTTGWVRKS